MSLVLRVSAAVLVLGLLAVVFVSYERERKQSRSDYAILRAALDEQKEQKRTASPSARARPTTRSDNLFSPSPSPPDFGGFRNDKSGNMGYGSFGPGGLGSGGGGGFGGFGGGFPGGGFPGGGGGFPSGGFGQQQPLFVGTAVTLLAPSNFKTLTARETRGTRVVLLEFFTSTCSACREVHAPLLAKMAEQLHGAVLVAAVDCSPGTTTERICAAQKVAAFPTLRLLSEGGSADVPEAEMRSETLLRNFVLARLPANKVALTDGDGPASRAKMGSLARRCATAIAAAAGGAAGGTAGGASASAPHNARSRGSMGCAVLFSDKKEPSPVWTALSLSAELDATRPGAPNASSVADRSVAPAQLPGFVFVFAHAETGADGKGVRPGVAADLGVRSLPAVALLHGAALADLELREIKWADAALRRRGEVESLIDSDGAVRGRRLLGAAAVAGGYETLRAALVEHQHVVGLALRAAARGAARRAGAPGASPPPPLRGGGGKEDL